MERYQRVVKPKPELPINENEIRVTAQGLLRNYITYAVSLLQDKGGKEIILKAMGQAISKAVAISEIIKKRIPGLHQDIATSSTSITDTYEPIEEGLRPLEMKRQVSLITIKLSTVELNKSSPGYQSPVVKQPKDENEPEHQQAEAAISESTNVDKYVESNQGRGRGWGRGRGRGRGRRPGRGRGVYDNGRNYNWGRGGGRGGNWGYQGDGYGSVSGRGSYRSRGYGYGSGRTGGRGRINGDLE